MARITVLGGTGYAGTHVVREAAARGHQVRSFSRHAPAEPVPGVSYETGDVTHPALLDAVVAGTDVVVTTVPPRGELEPVLGGILGELATRADAAGVRLGVVGGAGSLLVAPGGPKLLETDAFPAPFLAEAQIMDGVLQDLRSRPESLDWFYVSPAAGFGAYAPGERTGRFRLGDDVLLTDDEGGSELSGEDLAIAVVDEVEQPAHRRSRFTVAY